MSARDRAAAGGGEWINYGIGFGVLRNRENLTIGVRVNSGGGYRGHALGITVSGSNKSF